MNLSSITLPKIGDEAEISKWMGLAAPVGAIIISGVIIVLILWPKFTQIVQLRNDNKQLAIRVESLKAKADKLARLDREDLDIKLGIVEQLLPSDKGVFTLVKQIEETSGASGILLNKIDLAPGSLKGVGEKGASTATAGTEGDSAPSIQLRVLLTGDYRSFEQFLKNIFSISRVLSVRDLSLSSSASSAGEGTQVRTSLTIHAYWLPLPKELDSIESEIEDLTAEELLTLEQIRSTGFISPPVIPAVPTGKGDLFSTY